MKSLKKLVTLLVSASMLGASMVSPVVTSASDTSNLDTSNLFYWGTMFDNSFKQYNIIDDEGMLAQGAPSFGYGKEYDVRIVTTFLDDTEYNFVYLFFPRANYLQFVLSDNVNKEEAVPDLLEILEKYYPGITLTYKSGQNSANTARLSNCYENSFELRAPDEMSASFETSKNIMEELNAKGLIKEFYDWKQTAYYVELTSFENFYYNIDESKINEVSEYLESNYVNHEIIKKDRDSVGFEFDGYQIDMEMSFEEKFKVAVDLYKNFGIHPAYQVLESANDMLKGVNSLENLQKEESGSDLVGDVNLDKKVNSADVVCMTKVNFGVYNFTTSQIKNADLNGDGEYTITDQYMLINKLLGDVESAVQ